MLHEEPLGIEDRTLLVEPPDPPALADQTGVSFLATLQFVEGSRVDSDVSDRLYDPLDLAYVVAKPLLEFSLICIHQLLPVLHDAAT